MRAFAWFASAGLVLSALHSQADEPQPVVGDLGNPDRVVVQGATTFTAAEIVEVLFGDLDVANAAYPTAPLVDLMGLLAEKALAGYQTAGFAEATAETRIDDGLGKLALTIVEGPRYLASEVHVTGLPNADADWLRQELTADPRELCDDESAETSRPRAGSRRKGLRWPIGKPAPCAQETLLRWHKQVEDLLLERGFVLPELTVAPDLDHEQHTATLEVAVSDQGQPALLDDILITGNQVNSRQDILTFLGLTPGMAYQGDLCRQAADKLAQSGRFIKPIVRLIKPRAPGDRLVMTVELNEYDKAPLLNEPLSSEEEALIKLSDWLAGFDKSDEEIQITLKGPSVVCELVASPRSGVVAVLRETTRSDEKPGAPFAFAVVIANDRLALYSARRQIQLCVRGFRTRLAAKMEIALHRGPPKLEPKCSLGFGLGIKPWSTHRQNVEVKFKATPVDMLSLAHEYRSRLLWNGKILTLSYKGKQLTFDGATGEFVGFASTDPKAPQLVRCTGEFERRVREIEQAASTYTNVANPAKSLTGVLCFFCDEIGTWAPEDDRKWLNALHRLFELGWLSPLDRYLASALPSSESAFSLPVPLAIDWDPTDDPDPVLRGAAPYLANAWVNAFLPRGCWAERLVREACFAARGKSCHLHEEISRQSSSRNAGPLCHLGMAVTLHFAGLSSAASRCAREGLRRMSPEDFRHDCECLLDPTVLAGACLTNGVYTLGQLDEEQAGAVCQALVRFGYAAETDRDKLAACLAKLRGHTSGGPRDEALHELFDVAWQAGLKDRIQRALRLLAGPPDKTNRNESQVDNGKTQDTSKDVSKNTADDDTLFKPIAPFGPAGKRKAKASEGRYR